MFVPLVLTVGASLMVATLPCGGVFEPASWRALAAASTWWTIDMVDGAAIMSSPVTLPEAGEPELVAFVPLAGLPSMVSTGSARDDRACCAS